MQININHENDTAFVCVVADGLCNHASTHIELADAGHYSYSEQDYIDAWREVDVCDGCGEEV